MLIHDFFSLPGMANSWVFQITHPCPTLLGQVWQHSNRRWNRFGFIYFFNPNQVQGWVGFYNNLTCLALPPSKMKLQVDPSCINICFPSSLHLSFQGSHSFLSLELSFLPLNAEIHLIIHAYHIIKSIGSLISTHHYPFLPPKHIFSHS